MWLPSMLRVRIRSSNRRFGLWLPLFLAWPLIVLVALALLPMVLVLGLLLWRVGWGRPLLLAGPRVFGLLHGLRGLMIDIESPSGRVYVALR